MVSIPFTRVSTGENLDERTPDRTLDGTLDKTPDRTSEENVIAYYENNNQSAKILQFCETPKGIYEIVAMLGYKDKKPARKYIKPLVEQGRLAMTIPDKPNSKYQKYVTVK